MTIVFIWLSMQLSRSETVTTPKSVRTLLFAGLAVSALTLSACTSGGEAANGDNEGPNVVATTTIWGDITSQIVACAGQGNVTTLMPVGADPHDYSPSSQDVATMVGADLVVANGLDLEEGLEASLESAQQDGATVFAVAPELSPIPFGEEETHSEGEGEPQAEEETHSEGEVKAEGEAHSEGEEAHGGDDPHVWLDMSRAATGAELIGQQLATQTGNDVYATCGEEVAADITATNAEVTALLESVPADRRVMVTDHEAFGYFSKAYGYEVVGVVIPGGSTLGEPSSTDLAQLAATIQAEGVPVIFSNTASPSTLVDALASEAGNVAVVPLYEGSVGEPGSQAATFQGMMLVNAQRISEALKG